MPAASSAEARYHAYSLRRREIVLADDAARLEETSAAEVAKLTANPAPRFAAGAARWANDRANWVPSREIVFATDSAVFEESTAVALARRSIIPVPLLATGAARSDATRKVCLADLGFPGRQWRRTKTTPSPRTARKATPPPKTLRPQPESF
jgi:hypothetical protein